MFTLDWAIGVTFEDVEKEVLRQALIKCEGHITKTAEALKVTRPTIYRKMKQHFSENERLFLTKRVVQA